VALSHRFLPTDFAEEAYFYMCFSEIPETLIQESGNESEIAQGYHIGRVTADALRTHIDPTMPDRLDDIGKAEFLLRLAKMPSLDPKLRFSMVPKKQSGLIEWLRRFIGKGKGTGVYGR